MLNFDADVKNATTRHQRENRTSCYARGWIYKGAPDLRILRVCSARRTSRGWAPLNAPPRMRVQPFP